MAMLGQASGGFTESSSSLRLLHVGVRNSTGVLADDAFTQSNPANITDAAVRARYIAASPQVATSVLGVLSGSVAFTRGDADGGNNEIGGLGFATFNAAGVAGVKPIGVFLNHAAGYSFENTPALASSKSPYVSAQGTYANSLYETYLTDADTAATLAVGDRLVSSVNGILMSADDANAAAADYYGAAIGGEYGTVIGILKMTADSAQDEIMYDQRI